MNAGYPKLLFSVRTFGLDGPHDWATNLLFFGAAYGGGPLRPVDSTLEGDGSDHRLR